MWGGVATSVPVILLWVLRRDTETIWSLPLIVTPSLDHLPKHMCPGDPTHGRREAARTEMRRGRKSRSLQGTRYLQNTVIGWNKTATGCVSYLIALGTVSETGTQTHDSTHAFILALMSYYNCLRACLLGGWVPPRRGPCSLYPVSAVPCSVSLQ